MAIRTNRTYGPPWTKTDTGEKYYPSHQLNVNGTGFNGIEHFDDLIDQAMAMYPQMTRNRIDVKAVLADPLIRDELIEGATDFICKVENIHRERTPSAMPQLSSQAQEVFWAFNRAASGKPDDWHYLPAIAAALRAAATILREAYANEEYADPADDWLDDIATELEAFAQ